MFETSLAADRLLHALSDEDIAKPNKRADLENYLLTWEKQETLPLYQRILVGVGAFIASVCFFGALMISNLITFNAGNMVFMGLLFTILGCCLHRVPVPQASELRKNFLAQLSFCGMAMGKILFIAGIAEYYKPHTAWAITAGAFFITLVTYYIYPVFLERFLSCLGVLLALFFSLIETSSPGMAPWSVTFFFFSQLALSGYLILGMRLREEYKPLALALALAYASAFALSAVTFYVGFGNASWASSMEADFTSLQTAIMNTALGASLIA
ncbi:MAG: conserved rane protein of unknown function, partial [Alphaproteobacteria bacterium]|nr:conserved rane protein of unknown function [Alphaproteobacteria bacterium]